MQRAPAGRRLARVAGKEPQRLLERLDRLGVLAPRGEGRADAIQHARALLVTARQGQRALEGRLGGGGVAQAARAADAPIELPPSFQDMSPTSEYLAWLFYQEGGRATPRRLPPDTAFHMLFGFRMSGSSDVATDGTATVASQARLEAQEEALSVRALDLGHVDILESPLTLERVNRLLGERFRWALLDVFSQRR